MDGLATALEALDIGDGEAALEALLGVWRDRRQPAVAELVDLLSARLTADRPAAPGARAWVEMASGRVASSLVRLLERILEAEDVDVTARFDELLRWPADPRLAKAAMDWLGKRGIPEWVRPTVVAAATELLGRQRDVRFLGAVRERSRDSSIEKVDGTGRRSAARLKAIADDLAAFAPPPLSPAEEETRALLEARLRDPKPLPPPPLLAAVHADPADDGARLVLADTLQQRGDPRGVFIALQMRPAGGGREGAARERALLDVWGRCWLGPLEPLLGPRVRWARGFPVEGTLLAQASPAQALRPEWATFETLDVTGVQQSRLLLSPAARALRHVRNLGAPDFHAVADAGSDLRWESLAVCPLSMSPELRVLFESRGLPELRRLAVSSNGKRNPVARFGVAGVETLLGLPLGAGLEELEVALPAADLGALVRLERPRRLVLVDLDVTITLDRAARSLDLAAVPTRRLDIATAVRAVSALPAGLVGVVRVERCRGLDRSDLVGLASQRGARLQVI